ncbi:hypothetical protein LTR62_005772 [Meristemomyces frigidus]|uniref:Zn(2)-C6 fungal-type domain-containing protein n=1 Tax=Meristemomyces frigidus TaxID=1508187 RepID=A0AAN7YEZ2_9PEZI|nr:hypothetical protein LTR62_005772 [Meristemomyces frigidus]
MPRDGCKECSKRRIECDKGTPECRKCLKKGITCTGYGRQFTFVGGIAIRGKFKGQTVPLLLETGRLEAGPGPISQVEHPKALTQSRGSSELPPALDHDNDILAQVPRTLTDADASKVALRFDSDDVHEYDAILELADRRSQSTNLHNPATDLVLEILKPGISMLFSYFTNLFVPPLLDRDLALGVSSHDLEVHLDILIPKQPGYSTGGADKISVFKTAISAALGLYIKQAKGDYTGNEIHIDLKRLEQIVLPVTPVNPGMHILPWVYFIAAASSKDFHQRSFFSARLLEVYQKTRMNNIVVAIKRLEQIWLLQPNGEWARHPTLISPDELVDRSLKKFVNVDGKYGRIVMHLPHNETYSPTAAKYDKISLRQPRQHELLRVAQIVAFCEYSYVYSIEFLAKYKFHGGQCSLPIKFFQEASGTRNLSWSFNTPVASTKDDGSSITVATRTGQSFQTARMICAISLNILKDVSFSPALSPEKLNTSQTEHVNKGVKVHTECRNRELRAWTGINYPNNKLLYAFGDGTTPNRNTHIVAFGAS